jgi:predicted nucleic acid-binding protein
VLAMAFARKFDLIVSAELFTEYDAVIRRPKFRFRPEEIDEALTELRRTDHADFMRDATFQKFLVREMRKFLLGE